LKLTVAMDSCTFLCELRHFRGMQGKRETSLGRIERREFRIGGPTRTLPPPLVLKGELALPSR
jgi:hypothetical protein